MHKSSILAANVTEEIAEYTPVEIGTRGTVGSLVMQEIEYFSRIELNSHDRSQKIKPEITDTGSSCSTDSRATNLSTAASTKKKRVSSKLLPSMCSMVDVSDKGRPNGTSAFSYKNLKSNTKKSASLDNALRELREAQLLETTCYRASPSFVCIPAFYVHNFNDVRYLFIIFLSNRASVHWKIIRTEHGYSMGTSAISFCFLRNPMASMVCCAIVASTATGFI